MAKQGLQAPGVWVVSAMVLALLLSAWPVFALPPVVSNVVLSSSSGLNTSSENLTVTWVATDGDGDSIKNITNWRVNSSSITALNLPMEGGSNSTWTKDYSGLGYNGSVSGATWGNTSGYDGFGAYSFDGVNDYIMVPDAAELEPGSFTLEVWFKPLSLPPDFIKIVSKRGLSSSGYQIYLDSAGSIIFSVDTGGGNGVTSASTVTLGSWYHAVGVYDGSTVTFYVNGVSQGSGALSGSVASTMDVYIGRNNPAEAGTQQSWDTYFNGSIDDVRFYTRSLSAEQVAAIFQNRTDLIVSQETSVGDVWQAVVTPNDGTGDGAAVQSNSLTVLSDVTSISSCTTINASGNYRLASNILNSAIQAGQASWDPNSCIHITASDVVFDGAGNTIDGVDNAWTVGVYAYNASQTLSNISVKNLGVSDFWTGILYNRVTNSTGSISSINGSSNTVGVQLISSSKISVRNSNLTGNADGVYISRSGDNMISKNNISDNTARGVYMDFCGECSPDSLNNTITDNNISGNSIGIFFDGATSNLVYNNYIVANTLRNAVDVPWVGSNSWNTSAKAGSNIIGGSVIGGNYWGDYLGSDTDEDGFGDTLLPYNSQGNITVGGDYLPLTGDTLPPKINVSNPVNGSTINIFNDWLIGNVSDSKSNVTVANVSLNGAYVGVYPINQSTGFFSVKMNYTPGAVNNISVSATDSAGNTGTVFVNATVRANSESSSYNATEGETVIVNSTLNNTDIGLEIVTSANLTFQINVTAVGNASQLNVSSLENASAYGLFDSNESAIGKFVEIKVSDNINSTSANLSSAVLKLYIKSDDLDMDGNGVYNGTGDFNISSVKIYWYNKSNSTWHPLVKGADYEPLGPLVYDNGVNETAVGVYLGFAFANISHFSVYGVSASVYGGGAVVAGGGADVSTPSDSDGDSSIPQIIGLQGAKSNLINLVSSDANYLGLIRQFNYFWHEFVDSPVSLRGPLSALGIHWAPMKYAGKLNPVLYPYKLTGLEGDVYTIASEKAMSKYSSGAARVVLTRGDLGVDSLAASSYAKILGIPILLTEPESLPPASSDAISRLGAGSVIVAGGPEAVSTGVEDSLPGALRIGGADRYETAVLIGEALLSESESDVVVVTDGLSPDATSLIVAYYYNAPIVYVSGDEVPVVTEEFLKQNKFKIVVTVGVSPEAGERLDGLVG